MLSALLLAASSTTAFGASSQGLPGPHNVKTKGTWDYKGPCGPGTVYYPDSSGNFPLLSFAHGMGGSGTKGSYGYTLNAVASWGYIIVALEGCEETSHEYAAQEAMMDWAFSHWSTIDHSHPGGIFGHSMGGGSSIAVAGDGDACVKYGLQGAFMMHPCDIQTGSHGIKGGPSWIPSLYVSGSQDGICSPGTTYGYYKQTAQHNTPRGFGTYKGYTHFSPTGGGFNLEAMDIANWFGCYLWYNQDSCGAIYNGFCGDGKKIPTGQRYGCELYMNPSTTDQASQNVTSKGQVSEKAMEASFETMWTAAMSTGDPLQVLALPWGHHNGTLAGFMHEIKTRGDWAVQQRKASLSARGLHPKRSNASEQVVVMV